MESGCAVGAGLSTIHGRPAEQLRRALRQWGERWHLTADWCLDWALEQLHDWDSKYYGYALDAPGTIPLTIEPPQFREYRPDLETRTAYLAAVQKALADYCADIERQAAAAGFKPTPHKRAPTDIFPGRRVTQPAVGRSEPSRKRCA